MKKLIHFLFLFPFIFNILNVQDWMGVYFSSSISQFIAYGNIVLIIIGTLLCLKLKKREIKTGGLWIFFFIIHYSISIIASAFYENPINIAYTFVNITFYIGYLFYLRTINNLKSFHSLITYTLLTASFSLIVLWSLQLDLDYVNSNIGWGLDRASGLYGDANNASLVSILAFIFFKFQNFKNKVLKIIIYLSIIYSVFLTFSTTGFLVFIVVLFFSNYKLFTIKKNLFLLLITLPIIYLVIINLNFLTSTLNLNVRQKSKIDNFVNIFTLNFNQIDNSGRDTHIINVIDNLYNNPFTGYGFDFGLRNLTHNTYLNIWLESGIIGLITLLLVIFTYFKRSMKTAEKIKYFSLCILISIAVFMLTLQTVINQPYIMVILIYTGYLIDSRKIKNYEKNT